MMNYFETKLNLRQIVFLEQMVEKLPLYSYIILTHMNASAKTTESKLV